METSYVLGHSVTEIERLERQADSLHHLTLRLLRRCGLGPGMSVLDIGTGAGDVAMAAARIVGGDGSVVGIDRNEPVLDRARVRAQAARLPNLRFERVDFDLGPPAGTFDLVVCRYVLIHQPEPVDFLRRAASNAKGGRLAVLEIANGGSDRFSDPPVDV